MLHPTDEQTLCRILGLSTVPQHVREEAELRTRMFHRDGNSGLLGTLALIAVARHCGCQPVEPPKAKGQADWGEFPRDGSVKVEANFFGGWQPGSFVGFGPSGTIGVKMADDGYVRECRPHMVRLVETKPEPVIELTPAQELITPTAETLAYPAEVPGPTLAPKKRKAKNVPPIEEVDEPPVDIVDEELPDMAAQFAGLTEGAPLWVEIDGEIEDAIYLSHDGGMVKVQPAGKSAVVVPGHLVTVGV